MKPSDIDISRIKALLTDIDMFSKLEAAALDELCELVEVVQVSCGELLMQRGEEGDCMYVIARGRVRIFDISDRGSAATYGFEVGTGQTVGELALLIDRARSASVQACCDCLLLKITRGCFDEIMSKWPGVSLGVSRLLARRLIDRQGSKRRRANVRTVALIPCCESELFDTFSERLFAALAQEGPIRRISSVELARSTDDSGDDDDGEIRWYRALATQEDEFRFTVLVADPGVTPWSEFCIRQSERALLVHAHADSRELRNVETFMFESEVLFQTRFSTELYLIHQSGDKGSITGTGEWLEQRPVYRHHHVFMDDPGDFQRARRFLSGNAVGLAIGGGGALGGYALGVFRALRERGIPVDMVGGNSAGSVIAGLIAAGHTDTETIGEKLAYFVKRLTSIFSYTIPIFGMMRRRKNNKIFQHLFADKQVEDLPISCFTVGTNTRTGAGESFRTGPLWRACRISTSLPAVSQPVVEDGDLMCDGALVINLPSEAMAEKCDGRIILVDLLAEEFGVEGDLPSPWRVFWSIINPFTSRIDAPYLIEIVFRTMCISNLNEAKDRAYEAADQVFSMPVAGYSGARHKDIWKTLEVGYEHAKEKLGESDWDDWPTAAGTDS